MATLATLIVNVVADTAQLFGPLDRGAANLERNLTRMSGTLTKIGTGLTAAVTLPIVGIGAATIDAAMSAVESENLFEVSFGGMADSARKWSEDLSDKLGSNQFELRRTSATLKRARARAHPAGGGRGGRRQGSTVARDLLC